MGFHPTEWVYWHSRSVGATRAILLAIAWFADNDTWTAWPSAGQIADMTKVSRATVFRGIADAVALNELDVTPGRGRGNPSRYQINPKESHPETFTHSKASQKGLIHADKRSQSCDQNSQEPMNHKRSHPETLSKPQPPTHCTNCQQPTWDCTCHQEPTIAADSIRDTLNKLNRLRSGTDL